MPNFLPIHYSAFREPLKTRLSKEEFIKFVKKDKGGLYSGIVKEYQPSDLRINLINIQLEMIDNLQLLYPIYDFMAWRSKR